MSTAEDEPPASPHSSHGGSESHSVGMGTGERSSESGAGPGSDSGKTPAKSDLKNSSRPRRKKARRACYACQRAHLTCGDERPCLRCIKRGLKDQCHDGVRKKAKYLHDAPLGPLGPGIAGPHQGDPAQPLPGLADATADSSGSAVPVSESSSVFPPGSSAEFSAYGAGPGQAPMTSLESSGAFPGDDGQAAPFQPTSGLSISAPTVLDGAGSGVFDNSSSFDPNDSSLFDFNIADMNFDNHYGALEFGMLGQMSSAVAGTPDLDMLEPLGQNQGSISYDGFAQSFGYVPSWNSFANPGPLSGNSAGSWPNQKYGLDAFAVGEHSGLYSPLSQGNEHQNPFSPENVTTGDQFGQADRPPMQAHQQELLRRSISFAQQQQQQQSQQQQSQQRQPQLAQQRHSNRKSTFPDAYHPTGSRRRLETSDIYNAVTAPYPYTQRFHGLIAFLQKHFPAKKVLRIAKSLASIRPSFISCNKNLTHDDLIFMEKCFQRTLVEYEDIVSHYGMPTAIFRRTGEVAAVSKELSLITGWRRDVLLGKEPNLNINVGTGSTGSNQASGAVSRGAATPRGLPASEVDSSRPQPVFIAELLDEDSVVQFYEDFAELAFGASGATVIGRPCSLLKYRPKDDVNLSGVSAPEAPGNIPGSDTLGRRSGRVACQSCWTIKRDVFDIPMLIIMNFLPVI